MFWVSKTHLPAPGLILPTPSCTKCIPVLHSNRHLAPRGVGGGRFLDPLSNGRVLGGFWKKADQFGGQNDFCGNDPGNPTYSAWGTAGTHPSAWKRTSRGRRRGVSVRVLHDLGEQNGGPFILSKERPTFGGPPSPKKRTRFRGVLEKLLSLGVESTLGEDLRTTPRSRPALSTGRGAPAPGCAHMRWGRVGRTRRMLFCKNRKKQNFENFPPFRAPPPPSAPHGRVGRNFASTAVPPSPARPAR